MIDRWQAQVVEQYGADHFGVVRQKGESITAYCLRALQEAQAQLKPQQEAAYQAYRQGLDEGRKQVQQELAYDRNHLRDAAQQVLASLERTA